MDGFVDMEGPETEDCDTGGDSQTCDGDCTAPACGDGYHNPNFDPPGPVAAEECDTGGNTQLCDSDCTTPMCGDMFVNPNFDPDLVDPNIVGEECDPPQIAICSNLCQNIGT